MNGKHGNPSTHPDNPNKQTWNCKESGVPLQNKEVPNGTLVLGEPWADVTKSYPGSGTTWEDVLTMTEIIEKQRTTFAVYSGDDGLTLPAMAVGAKGIVSVASHVIGNEMQEMITAFQAGEFKKAQNYINYL